jgi:predicted GNAT superfamily acetyltransferase
MKNIEKAKQYGKNFARQIYEDVFSKPEFRGENFTWKKFPKIASGLAKVYYHCSLTNTPKNLKELKEICKTACKDECVKLVKENGLI